MAFPQTFSFNACLIDWQITLVLRPTKTKPEHYANSNGSVLVACDKRVYILYDVCTGVIARHRTCNVCPKFSIDRVKDGCLVVCVCASSKVVRKTARCDGLHIGQNVSMFPTL